MAGFMERLVGESSTLRLNRAVCLIGINKNSKSVLFNLACVPDQTQTVRTTGCSVVSNTS